MTLSRERIVLLPFEVRLSKVAHVVGVGTDDPLLAELRAHRLDLGAHDFASGIKPDRSWSASRMALWVKSLLPVCASSVMHARYAALPENLSDLIMAAYGRPMLATDQPAITEALTANPGSAEDRYRSVCLSILSSVEFVAR